MNEELWLFNYGSLSMKHLYETLNKVNAMEFTSYLCGHSNEEFKKEKLMAHIRNIETLRMDKCVKQNTIGFDTYCSVYRDSGRRSEIMFAKECME